MSNMKSLAKAKKFFQKKNKQNNRKTSDKIIKSENDAQKTNFARGSNPTSQRIGSRGSSIVVKKREFVTNIVPTDPFQAQKIQFNPGLVGMFPWLSGVAPSFEKYIVRKLTFLYETSQSTFVPGMVMMAPEFNISDPVPSTKAELLEYAYATRGPVWKNFEMSIPSSAIMNYKEYYVRINEVTSEKKLYDPFYLIYATDAVSTDLSYCGELWIEYEIELLYPQRISQSVLLFNSFFTCATNSPTNSKGLKNGIFNVDGGLLISRNDDHSFRFNQPFTGTLSYLINVSNLGLSTSMWKSPSVCSLATEVGTIIGSWMVGGASTIDDSPFYISILYYIKNVQTGDLLNINNLGFWDSSDPDVFAYNCIFRFQIGYPLGL